MKLLKCHIENFGILSGFDYTFQEGLTVIREANGFGKSTLAAFIKAMFYGMPRIGARNIRENERRRYDPWQGGKYGGFLEFEHQGVAYRVTRYFGKTASKDSFDLIDLTNRRKSERFSDKMGEELFQLDADSFARSTYMPQAAQIDVSATTSIRTKLSNLVDNTNDLNNYDTARDALHQLRSKYKPYRGSGGQIQRLMDTYNGLEAQKHKAETQKPQIIDILDDIDRWDREKAEKTETVKELREKIRISSSQKAVRAHKERLRELQRDVQKNQQELEKLDTNYPAGYPTTEEIKKQRSNMEISAQSAKRLQTLKLSDEDCAVAEKEKGLFSDVDRVSEEINHCERQCNELAAVSARLTAQMLPEERQRLDELGLLFENGVPSEEKQQELLGIADDLKAKRLHRDSLMVPVEEQEEYDSLKKLFGNGAPDESMLADCEEKQHDLDALKKSREGYLFTGKDQADYQALQRTFASGMPTEQEIQEKQKDCRRITELTGKKNAKTVIAQKPETKKSSLSPVSVSCGLLGAVLIVIGIICLTADQQVVGILLLVGGFLALLASFWVYVKQMMSGQQKGPSMITASAITDEENQELYDLQHSLNDFLYRFYPDVAEPENRLVQLLIDTKRFAELKDKKEACEDKVQRIDQEIGEKYRGIRAVLDTYYPGRPYAEDCVKELRESCRRYRTLKARVEEVSAEREKLSEQITSYRRQLTNELQCYYPSVLQADLRQGIQTLITDATAYEELRDKQQAMQRDNANFNMRARELNGEIQNTLVKYEAYDSQVEPNLCLQKLRKRFEAYKEATDHAEYYAQAYDEALQQKQEADIAVQAFVQKYRLSGASAQEMIEQAADALHRRAGCQKNLEEASEKLKRFLSENPDIEQQFSEEIPDYPELEVLQRLEKTTQEQIEGIESKLRRFRQDRDSLRRSVERIPEWDDQMAYISEERQEAEKKCSLLDQTMELLSQAKDNLANSYVGKVERGFESYASSFLEGELGHAMIDKDLKLYVDEQGAAREVGCFSAGMADSIMICMRLALIDALFTKEKPFLILDDPFVNLDDEHTGRALKLLEEITRQYQVIYLVCNSGRSPEVMGKAGADRAYGGKVLYGGDTLTGRVGRDSKNNNL